MLEGLRRDRDTRLNAATAARAVHALTSARNELLTFDPNLIFERLITPRAPSPSETTAAFWAIAELDRHTRAQFFELLLVQRDKRLGRAAAENRSVEIISELLRQLSSESDGRVFDPAAGEGGFLYALRGDHGAKLRGVEISFRAWRTVWQRFLVHDVQADLFPSDSFVSHQDERADVVVLDPPYNQQATRTQLDYMNQRWPNIPARKVANTAWLYRAFDALAPDGTAYVLLPTATLFRRDEASTRVDLVRRGALEAIITLPAGSAAATRIPVALWILKTPAAQHTRRLSRPADRGSRRRHSADNRSRPRRSRRDR